MVVDSRVESLVTDTHLVSLPLKRPTTVKMKLELVLPLGLLLSPLVTLASTGKPILSLSVVCEHRTYFFDDTQRTHIRCITNETRAVNNS